MTPEEQADELYYKYSEFEDLNTDEIKKCCIICVNTLINNCDTVIRSYWNEVKNILNKVK
jgi:hypothetical protein